MQAAFNCRINHLTQRLKVRHCLESTVALVDLAELQGFEPVEAEILHIEGSHDAAENNRLPDPFVAEVAGVCQIPHEAACKGISCAGGIEDRFQRVGRSGKDRCAGKEEHAVLPPLDDQLLGAHCLDCPGSLHEV